MILSSLRFALVFAFFALTLAERRPSNCYTGPRRVSEDRMERLLAAIADHINHGGELKNSMDKFADELLRKLVTGADEEEEDEIEEVEVEVEEEEEEEEDDDDDEVEEDDQTQEDFNTKFMTSHYKAHSNVITAPNGKKLFQLHIRIPHSIFSSAFNYDLESLGNHVSGRGVYIYHATNLTVSFLNIQINESEDEILTLESVGFALRADNITAKTYGMNVDKMPTSLYEQLEAKELLQMINRFSPSNYDYENLKDMADRDSVVGGFISDLIDGHSMDFVLCWLKQFTSTHAH